MDEKGYAIEFTMFPPSAAAKYGKIRLRVFRDGKELHYAYALICEKGDYGVIQAISFAARRMMQAKQQERIAAHEEDYE